MEILMMTQHFALLCCQPHPYAASAIKCAVNCDRAKVPEFVESTMGVLMLLVYAVGGVLALVVGAVLCFAGYLCYVRSKFSHLPSPVDQPTERSREFICTVT